jgi:uncharacterized protein DUF1573
MPQVLDFMNAVQEFPEIALPEAGRGYEKPNIAFRQRVDSWVSAGQLSKSVMSPFCLSTSPFCLYVESGFDIRTIPVGRSATVEPTGFQPVVVPFNIFALAPHECRFSPEDTTLKYKLALLSRAYFAVTGLAILGLALMLAYRSSYQHPVLYCETDSVDFGDVYAGQLLSQTFVLKNRGDVPLDLHLKTTSCSCIDPKIEPTRDGALLSVKLVMPQHQKDVEGFVTVETNDPGQPLKRFVVRARALNFFQVSPQSVNFGNLDITKASSEAKEITVSADPKIIEGISFKVEDIVSPSPVHFQVSRSADRTSLKLKVFLDEDLAIGPLTAKVFLMHSQEVIKPTLIPIRGIVRGKVRSDPVEVFLDVPEGTDVLRSVVSIVPADSLVPLKIEDAHVLGELAARCKLSVSNDGGSPSCTFVLEPGRVADRSQLVRDIVQIRTNINIHVNVPIVLSYH